MPIHSVDNVLLAEWQAEQESKRKYIDRGELPADNDTWFHGAEKLPRASALNLSEIHGVLPFDGVRDPSSRSNTSQKVFFTYRVSANNWMPKVGKAESWGEAAVSLEAIMSPNVCDVGFQPCKVEFCDDDGTTREYTHDLLVTFQNGYRRLIFVRNEASLKKPRTQRQISAIAAATPKDMADDMIVVNANDYSRQRRENLLRMHHFVFHPDAEADEAVFHTARSLRSFYYMKDLFLHAPVSQSPLDALVTLDHLKGNRTARICNFLRERMTFAWETIGLDLRHPKVETVRKHLEAWIWEENKRRKPLGLPQLSTPSRKTLKEHRDALVTPTELLIATDGICPAKNKRGRGSTDYRALLSGNW